MTYPMVPGISGASGSVTLPGHEKVVIVEPDESVRRVLRLALEWDGFEIQSEVAAPEEAVSDARSKEADFIVLDESLVSRDDAAMLRSEAPGSRLIAVCLFSTVATEWADAAIPMSEIGEMGKVLRSL